MRFESDIYYVWVGGSCDYGHAERSGGAAYIMEKDGAEIDRYVISETGTTEFRMMLKTMIHAMTAVPEGAKVVFLTNVAYLQNFDRTPTGKEANPDLILDCIKAKERLSSASVKIVQYHKFPLLIKTHDMAHEAMTARRGY